MSNFIYYEKLQDYEVTIKIICILLLIYSIKYVVDRIKGKKENIGLDNSYIIGIIGLILAIIFI